MKKNAFTLVELLATIMLLGVLMAIGTGIVINSLGSAKTDIDEVQKKMILSTAESYFNENVNITSATEYYICVRNDLINEGYMSEFKNQDGQYGYGKVKINVTFDSNGIVKTISSEMGEYGYADDKNSAESSESDCYGG